MILIVFRNAQHNWEFSRTSEAAAEPEVSKMSCGTWHTTSFCNLQLITGTSFLYTALMSDVVVIFSTVKINFNLKRFDSMVTARNSYEYIFLCAQ